MRLRWKRFVDLKITCPPTSLSLFSYWLWLDRSCWGQAPSEIGDDLFINLLINLHHSSFLRGSSFFGMLFCGKCSLNRLFEVGGFYPKRDPLVAPSISIPHSSSSSLDGRLMTNLTYLLFIVSPGSYALFYKAVPSRLMILLLLSIIFFPGWPTIYRCPRSFKYNW